MCSKAFLAILACFSLSLSYASSSFDVAPAPSSMIVADQPDDVLSVLNQSPFVSNPALVDAINSNPSLSWKAKTYSRFEGMTRDEYRVQALGVDLDAENAVLTDFGINMKEDVVDGLPANFDAREFWAGWIHAIMDQQSCGSCWAFAATEVLSDRFAIASKGKVNTVLSPEDMVSCDRIDNGCGGGSLPFSWHFLKKTGVVSDRCFPYTADKNKSPKCLATCVSPDENYVKYKASQWYKVGGFLRGNPDAIMTEIMQNGPVEAAFQVHSDFDKYSSGVYTHTTSVIEGGHAVKIVGWGTDAVSGVPYWIVANSWGEDWGEKGFFRIR
mmetsp:Transcript_7855/g.12570  ORF Transcript_7855/g.12570 Transcript_7855/m.12570 type:complete len:327 (-) Transcript_7855:563-1543(-)